LKQNSKRFTIKMSDIEPAD